MAPITINRTPFNALIDDSGNNLDGSLWDKAAIKTTLLDPIDQALAKVPVDAATGKIPDSALSANVALRNAINTFSGAGTYNVFSTQVYSDGGLLVRNVLLDLQSGQLKFPATQAPSTDPNTLDDYEEGAFTPTLIGTGGQSGQAYSSQLGTYIKTGRKVTCTVLVTLSTVGTFTGTVKLGGLPFASDTAMYIAGPVQWNVLAANFVNVVLVAEPAATTALVRGAKAAAPNNATDLVQGDLAAGSTFIATVTYRVTN